MHLHIRSKNTGVHLRGDAKVMRPNKRHDSYSFLCRSRQLIAIGCQIKSFPTAVLGGGESCMMGGVAYSRNALNEQHPSLIAMASARPENNIAELVTKTTLK